MPVVHFQGKVLPYDPKAFTISINNLPPVNWNDPKVQVTIRTEVNASIVDVEFELKNYDDTLLESLLMRAWDLARAAVDLYSFKVGWGLTVYLDTLIKPDGSTSTIRPEMPTLTQHITALESSDPTVNNFDICYRLLVSEPALFMALNDLVVSITLPHHATTNCARAIEGLRVLMTSATTPRAQAWPTFQQNLNIDRAYREFITETSTGPRHGDRTWIPGTTVNEVVTRSWIIMNRFLEYRKRGNQQLPLNQFRLLTG
jgi:hypothetical protein